MYLLTLQMHAITCHFYGGMLPTYVLISGNCIRISATKRDMTCVAVASQLLHHEWAARYRICCSGGNN